MNETENRGAQLTNREIPHKNQRFKVGLDFRGVARNAAVAAMAGLFLGYLAPFGMDEFHQGLTISYWVVTCVVGYAIYGPVVHGVDRLLGAKISKHWQRVCSGQPI